MKFAKEHPLPNENEQSWSNAFEFVNATKQEEKKETANPNVSGNEQPITNNE